LQEGIFSQEAYDLARAAGIPIVMNLCLLKEHQRSRG
jgi:predicted CoA-binding protein